MKNFFSASVGLSIGWVLSSPMLSRSHESHRARAYQLQTKVCKLQLTVTMVHVKNEEERHFTRTYIFTQKKDRFTFFFRDIRLNLHCLRVKMNCGCVFATCKRNMMCIVLMSKHATSFRLLKRL